MIVNLFIPCSVDWFYPEIGKKTVYLLEKAGYEVLFDPKQVCCGRYAELMGCKSLGQRAKREWATTFLDLKGPLVFPDSACYAYVKERLHDFDWSRKEQGQIKTLLKNCHELSQFMLEHTKLSTTSSFGKVGVFEESPLHQILSNSLAIPNAKLNEIAQVNDVAPLFFKNITNRVKKDFLNYLRLEMLLDVFVDSNVVLVRQLQQTAKEMGSPLKILHFTDLSA